MATLMINYKLKIITSVIEKTSSYWLLYDSVSIKGFGTLSVS